MSIFEAFLSSPDTLAVFSDRNFVAAMLRFESELARAQCDEGLVPASALAAIVACCEAERFDPAAIVRTGGRAGSVAIPLVERLKEAVAAVDPAAVAFTHFGSTSQDVIDTAMALLTREAVDAIARDLHRAVSSALALAERHASTPMLARTLMQPASVTSFGLKCAGWAAPLVRSHVRLRDVADAALQVQLGGAVGTLSQMGGRGPAVARRMAERLQLRPPDAPWHTQRDTWVALACELGLIAGSLGKIGRDLSLMSQFEVAEAFEPTAAGRGGSSAMPHKRNPVACMTALSAAQRAPQHVAALLAAMPQEHERSLGAWQAELAEWPALVLAVHGSVAAVADALHGLLVDASRMRHHIDTLRGAVPASAADEWFSPALAEGAARMAIEQVARLRGDMAAASSARPETSTT